MRRDMPRRLVLSKALPVVAVVFVVLLCSAWPQVGAYVGASTAVSFRIFHVLVTRAVGLVHCSTVVTLYVRDIMCWVLYRPFRGCDRCEITSLLGWQSHKACLTRVTARS